MKVIIIISFFFLFSCRNGIDPNIYTKPKTVVIIGNSIIKHEPKPEYGWFNDWGMAASCKDSDLVHLLIRDMKDKDNRTIVKYKNVAEFEMSFRDYDFKNFDSLKGADIYIIKLGENVEHYPKNEDAFMNYYDKMISHIDPDNKAVKIIVSGWWEKRTNILIGNYAKKNDYAFVNIQDLSKDSSNCAYQQFKMLGVARHPNDKGMRVMSERIWQQLKKYFK
jgi:hypothetical protein